MKTVLSPQEYFEKIKDLRSPEEIKSVCEQLITDLFNPTDKPKTRINKLTPYKKLIETLSPEQLVEGENAYIQTRSDGSYWKRHLHFKYSGTADTNFNGKGGINNKNTVLSRLENQQLVDVEKYLETTQRLLVSNDPHELAVGLIAASGRRPIEILARGSFILESELPIYLKPGYFVHFKGQVKKREYDVNEDEKTEYRIGLLVTADSFLQAFKRFRQMPETQEILQFLKAETKKGIAPEVINKSIEDRRGNSLRRVVKTEFGSFLPKRHGEDELNNKALRAVYVQLITKRDCPKNVNYLLWASRSVGHFVDSSNVSDRDLMHLVTTLGYSDYYVQTAVPFLPMIKKTVAEKNMQVRVSTEDFELIKDLQKKWNLPNQQAVLHQLVNSISEVEKLKYQLLEAQAEINRLQQEKSEVTQPQIQPESQDLQLTIRTLIKEELQNLLPQLQSQIQSSGIETSQQLTQEKRQSKAKTQTEDRDWESVPSEELKASKHRGAAEEKIRRAYLAITSYNDVQPSNDKRWVLNNQSLRQVSGCNGMLVKDWMESHKLMIDDHNHKYGLGQYHNKNRGDITQVISW